MAPIARADAGRHLLREIAHNLHIERRSSSGGGDELGALAAGPAGPAVQLSARQQAQGSVVIPAYYSDINDSPMPGTVAGIVLGSVAGFLFLLWLIYLCFNARGPSIVAEEEVVTTSSNRRRTSRTSHASRREEHHESERSRSRSRSPRRRSPTRERIVVEERRERTPTAVERDDDIVEVFEEEGSPPPRRTSRRQSGFRTVDPSAYGGGNRQMEEVYRKSSRKSRK